MEKYNDGSLDILTLGKKTDYNSQYDATLLQAVPRNLNRQDLNIVELQPFSIGEDIWTAYELSWLNNNGIPQVAIADIRVDYKSPNLIESKSFKLYLNSLNQTTFKSKLAIEKVIQKDLSLCAGHDVIVKIHNLEEYNAQLINQWDACNIDNQDIVINHYHFDHTLLENCTSPIKVKEALTSNLLKSNCLITSQPDWGSLLIEYEGEKINHEALLRYLISFRQHNEFHEQCVERIFCDLMKFAKPDKLLVYARYTRRGGLDINPYRANYPITINNMRLARQ